MNFYFSRHAVQRMFERNINEEIVIKTIMKGKVIKEYPDDKPYPSKLVYSGTSENPIHVVYSVDREDCNVITVYRPALEDWENDFITRRRKR